MPGCVQGALAPQIDAAVGRVLARRGIELVALDGAGCCGALPHHMGREEDARALAKNAIIAYEQGQYDGVLITATGCSAQLKDYAHSSPAMRNGSRAPPNSPPPPGISSNFARRWQRHAA